MLRRSILSRSCSADAYDMHAWHVAVRSAAATVFLSQTQHTLLILLPSEIKDAQNMTFETFIE
jgi:hypothetical protein